MDPPSEKFVPGGPELVSRTEPGLSTTSVSVCVESLWFTNVTFGAVIVTTDLLVPLTLYVATCVAPVHVRFALAQLKTPVLEIATVAPDHVPGASVIVPRSRFCSHVRIKGFTTFALTCATWVDARPGSAPATAQTRNRMHLRMRRCGGRIRPSSTGAACSNVRVTARMVYFRSTMDS